MHQETSGIIDSNPLPSLSRQEAVEGDEGKEVAEMRAKLNAKYEGWVSEVMKLTGTSIDDEAGMERFKRLMSGRDAFVEEAVRRTLGDKSKSVADAEREFDAMLKPAEDVKLN